MAALLLAPSLPARADATRAVVVGPASADVVARLQDELAALGLDVDVVAWDGLPPWRVLRDLARAREATVAIAVAPQLSEIEIWIVDRATGKATVRSVAVPAGDPDESARIGALRAVELLRVSLRELEAGPPPPEAEVGAPPEVAVVAAPPGEALDAAVEPARWWLGVGAGMLWARGGTKAVASLAAGLRWLPLEFLSVAVTASLPVSAARVSAAEGETTIRPWWAFVEVRWLPLEGRGWFQPDAGLGLGVTVLTMEGTARDPFVGTTDEIAAFEWHGVVGLELRPVNWLGVRLDTCLGMTIPEIGVSFAGRRVAHWGRPLVGASLALEVGW